MTIYRYNLIIDKIVIYTPVHILYGKPSQQTISFEYRTNSLGYDYWNSYFNTVWDDPEFAKDGYNEL